MDASWSREFPRESDVLDGEVHLNPMLLAILLFGVGLMLLSAELVIPAHGVTAGLGLLSLLCGVIACFAAGEWIGVGVLAAGAIIGPVAAVGWMQILTRSRLASRVILPPVASLRPGDQRRCCYGCKGLCRAGRGDCQRSTAFGSL